MPYCEESLVAKFRFPMGTNQFFVSANLVIREDTTSAHESVNLNYGKRGNSISDTEV